jgi:hypothetical protein
MDLGLKMLQQDKSFYLAYSHGHAKRPQYFMEEKHKMHDNNYNCPICTMNVEETTFHLFFKCPFGTQCWNHLGINWDFILPFHMMMVKAKHHFNSEFFMKIFMLGTWLI